LHRDEEEHPILEDNTGAYETTEDGDKEKSKSAAWFVPRLSQQVAALIDDTDEEDLVDFKGAKDPFERDSDD